MANPNGKAVLRASLELFRQDRQMIWLPIMATVTAVIAFAVVTVPITLAVGRTGLAVILALACGSVVATSATVIFNVALVFAATDRIEGRTPTVRRSLAQAWQRKGVIFRWAVLSAIVGTAIRLLEQRLGLVGRLIGLAGGLAWVVATFLVIPVLAYEDVGPLEALKRSSSISQKLLRHDRSRGAALRVPFLRSLTQRGRRDCRRHHRHGRTRGRSGDRSGRRGGRAPRRHFSVRGGSRDVYADHPVSLRDTSGHPRPRGRRLERVQQPVEAFPRARVRDSAEVAHYRIRGRDSP